MAKPGFSAGLLVFVNPDRGEWAAIGIFTASRTAREFFQLFPAGHRS
jgi:hypothetical protein